MTLKVYAQNALDGFSHQKHAEEYIEIMQRLQPDVAFFSEAYKVGATEQYMQDATAALGSDGYTVVAGPYDENDGHRDKHGMLLAVRTDLVDPARHPIFSYAKTRNIIDCQIRSNGTSVHFLGMHLNDRDEARRQGEIDTILSSVNPSKEPTIIAGDLNSLHRIDARGGTFRKAHLIHFLVKLGLMPITDPTGEPMSNTLGRRGSVYFRLHEMASGKTIQRLIDNGLYEVDDAHLPTYPANNPIAQLDHILVSHHFAVKDFERLSMGSSDHRGIVAELEV